MSPTGADLLLGRLRPPTAGSSWTVSRKKGATTLVRAYQSHYLDPLAPFVASRARDLTRVILTAAPVKLLEALAKLHAVPWRPSTAPPGCPELPAFSLRHLDEWITAAPPSSWISRGLRQRRSLLRGLRELRPGDHGTLTRVPASAGPACGFRAVVASDPVDARVTAAEFEATRASCLDPDDGGGGDHPAWLAALRTSPASRPHPADGSCAKMSEDDVTLVNLLLFAFKEAVELRGEVLAKATMADLVTRLTVPTVTWTVRHRPANARFAAVWAFVADRLSMGRVAFCVDVP